MEVLRVAVLGTGGMARMHAKNLAAISGVSVVGVCGTSVEKGRAFVTETGMDAGSVGVFAGFERMMDETGANALVVAIPPYAHRGQTEYAARRGVHLLLEKPVEKSVAGARSILAAAEAGKGQAVVVHHQRFGAMVRRVGEAIASGEAGKVTLIQGRWFCNALHGAWWRDVEKSGGQVVEQAIHTYDLACWFAGLGGGVPTGVSGRVENLTKGRIEGYTVEDTHAAVVGFSSGAMASICASNAAVPGKWASTVTVVCERMVAEIRSHDEGTITWTEGRVSEDWAKTGGSPRVEEVRGKTELYIEAARAFVEAVRTGAVARPAATLAESVTALRVVLAVKESAAGGGKWIELL